ncbi:MAG: hypothetical protein M3041_17410 [Acidobacteriota bacterium]|nr:hypothetical protein [Acidobacteriota bacterium]
MRKVSVAAAVAALLLLAACGSNSGLGGLGGIFGTPQSSSTGTSSNPGTIGATVNSVDTSNQRIDVTVNYVNNLRNSQGSQSIYYTSSTRVVYNGNTGYHVSDLERGDQISVTGYQDNNGRFVADAITVTRNVRG